MDFLDEVYALSAKAAKIRGSLETEEATKNALVMPFIRLLGYDVFNPEEVVPEYTADVLGKKGEKVDYAIIKDSVPAILFECKCCGCQLDVEHANQLYRYFTATEARIGVLTDGIVYRFFTDLDQPNVMDQSPFMVFDLLKIDETLVPELKKLSKDKFDLDATISAASELKYTRALKKYLLDSFYAPSEEFIRFFASKVYSGKLMPTVVAKFSELVPLAFQGFLNDQINERLKSVMTPDVKPEAQSGEAVAPMAEEISGIVTTEEELEGYNIVRAILSEICDVARVAHRDTKSYFGVLLDDNNRKPVCRLHFNTTQKYLGVFDKEKNEERIPIDRPSDIFKYGERLKTTALSYDE